MGLLELEVNGGSLQAEAEADAMLWGDGVGGGFEHGVQ